MTKNCLILGANSDMAKAIAARFAKDGYDLVLAVRTPDDNNKRFVADINVRFGVTATTVAFDAVDFQSHASFFADIEPKPSVVISVFGYLGDNAVAEKDQQQALQIINTNFVGQVSILNIVANYFEQAGEGTIIGISSVAGERGRQSNYIYGSSKAGFTAYLSGLRNRLFKANVHVLTVKPGFVKTKMTENLKLPPKITAAPEQVANAVWKGYKKKKNTLYVLPVWYLIMTVIKAIPEPIFKKLKL